MSEISGAHRSMPGAVATVITCSIIDLVVYLIDLDPQVISSQRSTPTGSQTPLMSGCFASRDHQTASTGLRVLVGASMCAIPHCASQSHLHACQTLQHHTMHLPATAHTLLQLHTTHTHTHTHHTILHTCVTPHHTHHTSLCHTHTHTHTPNQPMSHHTHHTTPCCAPTCMSHNITLAIPSHTMPSHPTPYQTSHHAPAAQSKALQLYIFPGVRASGSAPLDLLLQDTVEGPALRDTPEVPITHTRMRPCSDHVSLRQTHLYTTGVHVQATTCEHLKWRGRKGDYRLSSYVHR